jgi:cytochrome P450
MSDYSLQLVRSWSDGQPRNLHDDMMALTLRIVGKALFGTDLASEAHELGEALKLALTPLDREINGISLVIPPGWPTPDRIRLWRAVARLDRIVLHMIAQRRATGEHGRDLLAMLMSARDEQGGGMTDHQLRDETLTLLLAGHETTALALMWAWYLLSLNPRAERRLHDEVDAVLGGRVPTLEDLPRLAYVDMIVKEALRLYPPALEFGRETIAPCEVAGYDLPAGTNVMVTPYVVHRDPRWFDEPDQFKPERWADGLAQHLPRFAYFPFGGGPRVCIGQSFATIEAAMVVATLAQSYRFELQHGARVEPLPRLTLRLKSGLPVVVRRLH